MSGRIGPPAPKGGGVPKPLPQNRRGGVPMSRAFAALPLVVVATLSDGGTAHAGGHNSHTGTSPPTGHVTLSPARRPPVDKGFVYTKYR